MKSNELYFCSILSIRYLNPKLMGPAHDFVEHNVPKDMPKGFVASRSFHIAPDRGMSIMWFETQQDLDNAIPFLKDFQNAKDLVATRRFNDVRILFYILIPTTISN